MKKYFFGHLLTLILVQLNQLSTLSKYKKIFRKKIKPVLIDTTNEWKSYNGACEIIYLKG